MEFSEKPVFDSRPDYILKNKLGDDLHQTKWPKR